MVKDGQTWSTVNASERCPRRATSCVLRGGRCGTRTHDLSRV